MFRFFAALAVLVMMACAPAGPVVQDPEKVNDVLISFMTKAQAGFWDEAMQNITYEERNQMMDGDIVKPEYELAIRRVKLSAITKMPFSLDSKGRLVGIKAVLDASNLRYTTSDEQRSVNLNELDKARTERINRMREEGQKILEEQNREQEQGKDVIYTNRLTEEERLKALQGEAVSTKAEAIAVDEWQESTAEEPSAEETSSEESPENSALENDPSADELPSEESDSDETGSGWR